MLGTFCLKHALSMRQIVYGAMSHWNMFVRPGHPGDKGNKLNSFPLGPMGISFRTQPHFSFVVLLLISVSYLVLTQRICTWILNWVPFIDLYVLHSVLDAPNPSLLASIQACRRFPTIKKMDIETAIFKNSLLRNNLPIKVYLFKV